MVTIKIEIKNDDTGIEIGVYGKEKNGTRKELLTAKSIEFFLEEFLKDKDMQKMIGGF